MVTSLLVIAHIGPSFIRAVTEALSSFNFVSTMGFVHGVIGVITLI